MVSSLFVEIFTGYNKIERVLKSVPLPSPKDVSLSTINDADFEKITVPLTEDSHLRKFPPLEVALKDLTFGYHKELSLQQEVIRACCAHYQCSRPSYSVIPASAE